MTGRSSMPQVSVLMTVRDEEKHVAAAVDSILGQSFGDFEFVVVDDGSADGTADALRAYDDARLRVTISSPVGRAAALNCALAQARAPLIALMDADDVSVEDRLARQVDFLRSAPSVGVCATWLDVIDAQGETIATLAFPTRARTFDDGSSGETPSRRTRSSVATFSTGWVGFARSSSRARITTSGGGRSASPSSP